MDSNDLSQQKKNLSRKLRQFFAEQKALAGVLEDISRIGDVFIFGGTLRDLMISPSRSPRDIDIVIDGVSIDALAERFSHHVKRRTRFGGLCLDIAGWPVDIWPVDQTWAFQAGKVDGGSIEHLPETTFLSLEAVVAELPRNDRPCRIFEKSFFQSLADRVLELNLSENPFPSLCVLRSLITAAKLGFSIGPRLASYIAEHACEVDDLLRVQEEHYKRQIFDRDHFSMWLGITRDHVRRRMAPIRLPPLLEARQLLLWDATISMFCRMSGLISSSPTNLAESKAGEVELFGDCFSYCNEFLNIEDATTVTRLTEYGWTSAVPSLELDERPSSRLDHLQGLLFQ